MGFMSSRSEKAGQGIMGSARGFNGQGIMDGFVVFVFVSILLPEVACGSRYFSSGRQTIDVVSAPFVPSPTGLAPGDPQPGDPSPPLVPTAPVQLSPPVLVPPPPPPLVLPFPPPPVLPFPPPPVLPFPPPPVPPPPAPVLEAPPPAGSYQNFPPPALVLPPPPVEFPPPPAVQTFPPPTIVTPGDTWNESEKAGVVIASIAALLQVAVVVFLLVKRHQMLTTVEYDDIDDLEYDTPRSDNPDFRHVDSA